MARKIIDSDQERFPFSGAAFTVPAAAEQAHNEPIAELPETGLEVEKFREIKGAMDQLEIRAGLIQFYLTYRGAEAEALRKQAEHAKYEQRQSSAEEFLKTMDPVFVQYQDAAGKTRATLCLTRKFLSDIGTLPAGVKKYNKPPYTYYFLSPVASSALRAACGGNIKSRAAGSETPKLIEAALDRMETIQH